MIYERFGFEKGFTHSDSSVSFMKVNAVEILTPLSVLNFRSVFDHFQNTTSKSDATSTLSVTAQIHTSSRKENNNKKQ